MRLTRTGLAALFTTAIVALGIGLALISARASARAVAAVCTYCESTGTTTTSTGVGVPIGIGGGHGTTTSSNSTTTSSATPAGSLGSTVSVNTITKGLASISTADPTETVQINSPGQLGVSAAYVPASASTSLRSAHAKAATSKAIVLYNGSVKAKKAGKYKVKLTLTKAGAKALKPLLAHGRHPTITLSGAAIFTPTKGTTKTQYFTVSSKLNFKLPK